MYGRKVWSILAAVSLGAGLLAGCGNAQEEEGGVQQSSGQDQETFQISALLYSRGFEFMVALDQGIQDQCGGVWHRGGSVGRKFGQLCTDHTDRGLYYQRGRYDLAGAQ